MSASPYGDTSKSKKTKIDINLKSEDIGSGVRILREKSAKPVELSEQEKKLATYDSPYFIKNRKKNEFWLSRSIQRMCRSLKLEYSVLRNEFTRTLENETAQVVTIPDSQRDSVRDLLEEETKKFEQFILSEILPHSLALSSAIERATQVAKVLSQDDEISLDEKYIRMSHSDAISLKTISFFLGNAGIDKDIHNLYLEQFVLHRFAGGKSQIEKTLERVSHNLTKGQKSTEQMMHSMMKKMVKQVDTQDE